MDSHETFNAVLFVSVGPRPPCTISACRFVRSSSDVGLRRIGLAPDVLSKGDHSPRICPTPSPTLLSPRRPLPLPPSWGHLQDVEDTIRTHRLDLVSGLERRMDIDVRTCLIHSVLPFPPTGRNIFVAALPSSLPTPPFPAALSPAPPLRSHSAPPKDTPTSAYTSYQPTATIFPFESHSSSRCATLSTLDACTRLQRIKRDGEAVWAAAPATSEAQLKRNGEISRWMRSRVVWW
ncbi:hypothetical protein R3P38DRAFT_3218966 [Favolaschia claudopus]|uniref:Uncharacterized protein n=1 Tax=Favolaschia claudopus TaxID=2862362 RepID=A0AAW0A3U6_9AGAR